MWLQTRGGGGGGQGGGKKTKGVFKKGFFQKSYRIILGPPKYVLYLVWSVLCISTAIKTALKVALNGKFLAKVDHYNRTTQINFEMGPSVKFVL